MENGRSGCKNCDEQKLLQEAERLGIQVTGRRRFLQGLLGTGLLASLASFIYPLVRYVVPPESADLGNQEVVAALANELKPNSGKIFRFGTRPGLLIHTASGEYKALSATCTHLGCIVQFRPQQQDIWCACHNGVYDTSGRNVSGPPPRPLGMLTVHVRGDQIVVTRAAEA